MTKFQLRDAAAPMSGHSKVKATIVRGIKADRLSVATSAPVVLNKFSTAMLKAKLIAM